MFDHFWQPFGALDPFWEGSGSQGKPSEFWTPFLLDFWLIWGALGYPFGSLLARKNVKNDIRGTCFLRFWKSSSKNIEMCMISDPLQPSRLSSRVAESSVFTIYPESKKSPKKVPKVTPKHLLWLPLATQSSEKSLMNPFFPPMFLE